MATSGSWNYSVTAANVITAALENLGVLAAGASTPSADSTMCLTRLNLIAKQYQGKADFSAGLKVNTRQRITVFLEKGRQSYPIGPASTDARATTQYGRTTLSAAEAAGQTVLSITSNTDTTTYPGTTVTMANADIIGIQLDDGTIQWTTISGTPGATATVSVALTGAAAAGNYVYWFTARAQRFPVLEAAVLRDENLTDTPLAIYTDVQQYEALTDKTGDGDPTGLLFEPGRLNSFVTLDTQPQDVTKQLRLTVQYPSEDYDTTTDDIAYPQEAYRFLAWELAFEVADSYGREWTASMEKKRQEARASFMELNAENTSMHFQPGRD